MAESISIYDNFKDKFKDTIIIINEVDKLYEIYLNFILKNSKDLQHDTVEILSMLSQILDKKPPFELKENYEYCMDKLRVIQNEAKELYQKYKLFKNIKFDKEMTQEKSFYF